MYDSERGVALKLGIDDYSEGVEVVYLVKALILVEHLAVDAVHRFDASLEGEVYSVLLKLIGDIRAHLLDEVAVAAVLFLDIGADLLIPDGVEVLQSEILKLLLDLLNTETVSERCIHVHRFERGGTSLVLRLCVERAHIVQSVAQLYEDNTNVLRHREKHFTDVLHMCFFFIDDTDIRHFRESVDEKGYIVAELRADHVKARFIRAVLDCIVKKRRAD